MLFSEAIPENLLDNPNVARFVKVLDGMMVNELPPPFYGKTVEMEDVRRSFDPIRMERFNFYHFMLYEMGKIDWVNGFPKEVFERLAMNGYNIMAKKGSYEGLKLLAKSLWLGDIAVDSALLWSGYHLIPSDMIRFGFLPNGEDLNLLYDDERQFLYLYNGENEYYQNFAEVRMISPLFYMEQFRSFVATVLKKYLPMFDAVNTNFRFSFYNIGMVGSPYLYYTDSPSEVTTFKPVKL